MFWQNLGNFLTGKGWNDNQQVAANDDEERRRRERQQQTPAQGGLSLATPPPSPSVSVAAPKLSPSILTTPTVQIGDFSYTKNNDGTYTERSSGANRTQAQIDSLRGIQQQSDDFKKTLPSTWDNIVGGVKDVAHLPSVQDINDFTGAANRVAARTLIGQPLNLYNLVTSGFNGEEAKNKTEQTLADLKLSDKGNEGLASDVNYDSVAGRTGSGVGAVIGNAPLMAGQIGVASKAADALRATPWLAQLAGTGTVGKIGASIASEVAGGVPATIMGAAANPQTNAQDFLINAAFDAGLGGVGAALSPLRRALTRGEQTTGSGVVAGKVGRIVDEAGTARERETPSLGSSETVRPHNDPESAISVTKKPSVATEEPAITSPNKPALPASPEAPPTLQPIEAPTVRATTPEVPQLPPPVEVTPPVKPPIAQQQEAQLVKKLNEETTAPPVEVAPVATAPAETASKAATRDLAQQTTPVSQEAVQAAEAAAKRAQAPTEAIAQDAIAPPTKLYHGEKGNVVESANNFQRVLEGGDNQRALLTKLANEGDTSAAAILNDKNFYVKADKYLRDKYGDTHDAIRYSNTSRPQVGNEYHDLLSGKFLAENPETSKVYAMQSRGNKYDPRVQQAQEASDNLINEANASLASEGTDYGKLTAKLYKNSNPKNVPEPLTAAEREVTNKIGEQTRPILEKMRNLGLTDDDMGFITDHLPTGIKSDVDVINGIDDIKNLDFGFTKKRTGVLTDKEVEEGASQALSNYLKVGALLDDLPPETIRTVKLNSKDAAFKDMVEQGRDGVETGLIVTDKEIKSARSVNEKLIEADDAARAADKRVADGDKSDAAISARDKAQADASQAYIDKQVHDYLVLEKKTDAKLKALRENKEMHPRERQRMRTQLEAHLTDVANQTYYLQSTVRSNLLFGVGRIADQVNKGVQALNDALTSIPTKAGANSSFRKVTGRDLYGDTSTSRAVWSKVESNPALKQQKNAATVAKAILNARNKNDSVVRKAFDQFNLKSTGLTEAGSRYKIANKDAVSYFVSDANSKGITEVDKIANYVNNMIGTKEWKRVHQAFFDARNKFTGVPSLGNRANKHIKLNVRNAIYNALSSTKLSRSTRNNIADAVTIPIVGFPRLVFRLGVRGFDMSTLGRGSFLKAARIHPKNEAEALEKALLVRQGIQSAINGGSLIPLGVGLGAAGMTTGAYPTDLNERARWQRDKIQPYSLKIGNQYIEVGRYLGPLAFPLMMGAAVGRGDPQNIPATAAGLTQQFLANYGADSIGDVMQAAGKLASGDFSEAGQDFARWGAGITSALVPGSSALGTIGKAQDMATNTPAPDTSGGYVDALRARFPITRTGLPARKDTLGNPITQGNVLNLLPGISGGQTKSTQESSSSGDFNTEIDRLAAAGFETMPNSQNKNAKLGNNQAIANALIADKEYQSASDTEKADMLKAVLAGTKTKDISASIPIDEQLAIAKVKVMGSQKSQVWLENNDNALNYYQGKYDNEKANGTLTTKDKDITRSGTPANLLAIAKVNKQYNVPQDLIENFANITNAEWKRLSNEGLKSKLLAYDNARVKAGLPGKYGANSSSGSGGGGRKSVAFPASLGSLAGPSPTDSKYAAAIRNYKPIADLQIARPKAPTKRSISVKRGIVL